MRGDEEMLEARGQRVGLDAGKSLVEPCAHVAEHDVVARCTSVPLLPEGGGSLLHPPAPAWPVFLSDHPIGHIGATVIKERVEDVFRAEDAGVDVAVRPLHGSDEIGQHAGLIFRIHQILVERTTQRGLAAVVVEAGGGLIEPLIESGFDACGEFGVFPGVILVAEQPGGECDDPAVHVIIRGVGNGRSGWGFPGRPVVEADVDDALLGAGGEVIHIALHPFVVATETLDVTIIEVFVIGNEQEGGIP